MRDCEDTQDSRGFSRFENCRDKQVPFASDPDYFPNIVKRPTAKLAFFVRLTALPSHPFTIDKGPCMDTYADLIFYVGWPDTGAAMRRQDDAKDT